MSYSQRNTIASEIFSDGPLSAATLSYLEERAKNVFYDFVLTKFKVAQRDGLTKAKLARRLNKRPEIISRMLGAPGNWTLGTVAELLVGISKEELLPHSSSFLGRPPRNHNVNDLLLEEKKWDSPLPDTGGTTNLISNPLQWEKN